MSTAVTPINKPQAPAKSSGAQDPYNTVRSLVESQKAELARALPAHVPIDRFLRIVLTTFRRTPQLTACTQASLMGAVMGAAQLGLEVDSVRGLAYLIPRKNKGVLECTLLIGYKGLCDLAFRSEKVVAIEAHVVFEKDTFTYQLGDEPKLRHRPTWDDDPGQLRAVYCVATLKDGTKRWEVLHRRDIERIKKTAFIRDDSPWVTHEAEMWKKSAVRALSKYLPMATELQRAIAEEDSMQIDSGAFEAPVTYACEVDGCGVDVPARLASMSRKAHGSVLCQSHASGAGKAAQPEPEPAPASDEQGEQGDQPPVEPPAATAPAAKPKPAAKPVPQKPPAFDRPGAVSKLGDLIMKLKVPQRHAFWKRLQFDGPPASYNDLDDVQLKMALEEASQMFEGAPQ